MKNRDRYILKVNEYDMLIKIQATMLSNNCCVIEALTGISCTNEKMCMLSNCRRCIQNWLNMEEWK